MSSPSIRVQNASPFGTDWTASDQTAFSAKATTQVADDCFTAIALQPPAQTPSPIPLTLAERLLKLLQEGLSDCGELKLLEENGNKIEIMIECSSLKYQTCSSPTVLASLKNLFAKKIPSDWEYKIVPSLESEAIYFSFSLKMHCLSKAPEPAKKIFPHKIRSVSASEVETGQIHRGFSPASSGATSLPLFMQPKTKET